MEETTISLSEQAENILKSFFGANAVVGIFTASLLQFFWPLVNTLQMIVITVFFKLEHPFNADMVMIMILKLCSLDFIKAESLLKTLFDFRETVAFDEEITETGEVKSKFLDAGYESVIYIALLGPFFFFLIATLLFIFFKLLLKKIFKRCRDSCMRRYFMQSFNVRMILLRLTMESSFEIGLSSMITVLMVSN